MTTSATHTFNQTRDQIITRACILGGITGDGEAPNNIQLLQYANTLNEVLYELNVYGMPLWAMTEYTLTPLAGTGSYTIGLGGTYNLTQPAPLKVTQAWNQAISGGARIPLFIDSRYNFNLLGNLTSPGTVNRVWYDPPKAVQSSGQPFGTLYTYLVPDSNYVNLYTLHFIGYKAFDDFTAGTDTLDFPQYWINAITWALADQLAYESKLPFAERAMISKKKEDHIQAALSFGTEEGSLLIQPLPSWHWESYQ